MPYSWADGINIIRMSVHPKIIYRLNVILLKALMSCGCFVELDYKMYVEMKKAKK